MPEVKPMKLVGIGGGEGELREFAPGDKLPPEAIPWVVNASFSASKVEADQSIANNTSTKITFNIEDFDVGGGYDPATSAYTVPPGGGGKWVFGAALIYTATSSDDTLSLRLYKNGSQVGNIGYGAAGRVTSPTASGITMVSVAPGDTVELYAYLAVTSGSRNVRGAAGTTRFFGYKVND